MTDGRLGLSCERCVAGYYGSASDNELQCSPCDCRQRALTNPPSCDHVTGLCLNCRPGTTGAHCQACATHVVDDADCLTCEPGFWALDFDGCRGPSLLPNFLKFTNEYNSRGFYRALCGRVMQLVGYVSLSVRVYICPDNDCQTK